MPDEILKVVSRIPHPAIVAGCSVALATLVLTLVLRANRRLTAWISAAAIIFAGLAPLAAASYVKSRGIYHVHIEVIRPDQSLADIAQLKSSDGGELKMVHDGWEEDIPVKFRPADGTITFTAAVKDEFLSGKSSLLLSEDLYPSAKVELAAVTSAVVRGVVVDEDMRAVAGAKVSVDGNPEVVVTDERGDFVLPAHAGKGQVVKVNARKGLLSGRLTTPAGKVVEIILDSR